MLQNHVLDLVRVIPILKPSQCSELASQWDQEIEIPQRKAICFQIILHFHFSFRPSTINLQSHRLGATIYWIMDFNPIPLDDSIICLSANPLVRGSTKYDQFS